MVLSLGAVREVFLRPSWSSVITALVLSAVSARLGYRTWRLTFLPAPDRLGSALEGVIPRLVAETMWRAQELVAQEIPEGDSVPELLRDARDTKAAALAYYRASVVLEHAVRLASVASPIRRVNRRVVRILREAREAASQESDQTRTADENPRSGEYRSAP